MRRVLAIGLALAALLALPAAAQDDPSRRRGSDLRERYRDGSDPKARAAVAAAYRDWERRTDELAALDDAAPD